MNTKLNSEFLTLKFLAEDVATMKEKSETGKTIIRRWIKINVDELRKSLDLENWTEVNPREQNLNSKPAKAMKLTLTGDKRDIFHLLNRGISISAAECSVKNIKDKKAVENSINAILEIKTKEENKK